MDHVVTPTDHDRRMLRDSLRGFLETHWPVGDAVAWSKNPDKVTEVWRKLAAQGLATLGADPAEGGARELTVALEELGRAGCPAPVMAATLANILVRSADRGPAADAFADLLQSGAARLSFAFGAFDPDANACSMRREDESLSGTLRFVEGATTATHFLVLLEGPVLAIVGAGSPGVKIAETRALGTDGLAEVEFSRAAASLIPISVEQIDDLLLLARLCRVARAYGAARRAFELVVDYAKERRQFGQPIGRFQAIQHKLTNCLINLEGVRLTLQNAAANHDLGIEEWRYFASVAFAFANGALRQVSLETQHAFGAIGYAEEHEAPRHFRRTHLDLVTYGGGRRARADLAAYLLDGDRRQPQYDLGPDGNAFRAEVRGWLETHWSGERKAAFDARPYEKRNYSPEFAREVGEKGWIALSWPKEHHGQERTPLEQLAFMEEMERAGAPRAGAEIQATALMLFGTPAQQEKYLPEIMRGDAIYGMGYSEPNSGSDLASLRTAAVRDGDEWVINGQKIWTTTWWGNYMFLAARTDPNANPPHKGISTFIVPMTTPGITIKPARTMYDGSFSNIFYDDVRLPADALLGEVNGGWKVLTGALGTERGFVGARIVTEIAGIFDLLCQYVKNAAALRTDSVVRDRIGTLAAEVEVAKQLALYCVSSIKDGVTPLHTAAIGKVFAGELMERLGEAALDLIGMEATLSEGAKDAPFKGKLEHTLRHSLMWVISLGTNEIQRSLIAQLGLGLPR
jgi:alkylation response protein AidB-like acyl-CoA dehydrogenase